MRTIRKICWVSGGCFAMLSRIIDDSTETTTQLHKAGELPMKEGVLDEVKLI